MRFLALRFGIAMLALVAGGWPAVASLRPTAAAHPGRLARVRFIDRGLAVFPPRHAGQKGRVNMALFNQYALRTLHNQRASVRFSDGTTLHINENTDLLLADPHTTILRSGEANEILRPGTSHRIQTATAIAGAIGTSFDVQVQGRQSTITVIHGVVEVRSTQGVVNVKRNQLTVVRAGQAPSKPIKTNGQKAIDWTKGIPTPTLGDNLVLDGNGGQLVSATSDRPGKEARRLNDGRLDTSWETAPGATTGQSVILAFSGSKQFTVSNLLVDPSATGSANPSTDLKDFEIRISTNGTQDRDFRTIFTGRTRQESSLQSFALRPTPVRYVQLIARTNFGSADGISVAELEVVGVPFSGHLFNQPYGVAIDPKGNIDVAELAFGVVQRLSAAGKLLATIGSGGSGPGQISAPSGLAVDPAGNIYVVDAHGRIVKFSAAGKPLLEFGTAGNGPGQFANPAGIAADPASNLYIADANNNRIEKFTSSGQFLAQFGGRGSGPGQFVNGPFGIVIDPAGNIFATTADRIVKLSPSGQQVARIGGPGRGPGQFVGAAGIALDTQGNIIVADSENNRIQKFSPSGQFLSQWPTPGPTANSLVRPVWLAVDSQGFVYVTSGAHGGVLQKYAPDGRLVATWQ